jgi:ABC-type Fe3+/spermidine/putrescine transport system ATPase subunit
MDEPLSNLDAKLREDMRLEIRELTRSLGITILHVTHDQLEAMALADRLAVMNEGQILDIGSPESMYYAPRSQFVAEFMARTNWLDAIVMSERAVESSVGTVACAVPSDLGPGSRVLLGIRPEAITLRPTPPQTGAYFRGFIQSRLFLGDVSMYKVRVGDADLLVKANRYSTETEEVFLEAEPEKWLLFSRHQGEDAPPPT